MATPSWVTARTKNWTIEGKDSMSFQLGLGAGVKCFSCKNDQHHQAHTFAWLQGAAGLKAGADASALPEGLKTVMRYVGIYTRQKGNPLKWDLMPNKPKIHRAFSFQDLCLASAGAFTAGVDVAAAVGVNMFVVVGGIGTLFTLQEGAAEVKPSVELNAMNGEIGWFVPLDGLFYDTSEYHKQKQERLVSTPPSQRFDMDLGKI